MLKKIGQSALLFLAINAIGDAYVPGPRQPLLREVIRFSQEPSFGSAAVLEENVAEPIPDFKPIAVEERRGIPCIRGFAAFQQKVMQASHARPVMVFFYGERNESSVRLWDELPAFAQRLDKKVDVVAVNVFQPTDGTADDENYQLVIRCLETIKIKEFELPVILFFKDGLMCSSEPAIFRGDIDLKVVEKGFIPRLLLEKSKVSA